MAQPTGPIHIWFYDDMRNLLQLDVDEDYGTWYIDQFFGSQGTPAPPPVAGRRRFACVV